MKAKTLLTAAALASVVLLAPQAASALEVGDEAPDWTLPLQSEWGDDGATELSLSDLRGKTVLIDFWAAW